PAAAALTIERGRDLFEKLARANPEVLEYQADVAALHNSAGHNHRDSGQKAKALTAYQQAQAVLEKIVARQPSATYRSQLARTLFNLGNAHGVLQQRKEELRSYEAACELQEQLVREAPDALELLNELSDTLNNYGVTLARVKRFDESLTVLRRS